MKARNLLPNEPQIGHSLGFAFDLSYTSIELRKHISNQNDVEALCADQILSNTD
jgi:hypothetical protein